MGRLLAFGGSPVRKRGGVHLKQIIKDLSSVKTGDNDLK